MASAYVCDRCKAGDHCRGASDRPLTPEDIRAKIMGSYKCICRECLPIPHLTCPYCLATSWNPEDIENRYCGSCHRFIERVV